MTSSLSSLKICLLISKALKLHLLKKKSVLVTLTLCTEDGVKDGLLKGGYLWKVQSSEMLCHVEFYWCIRGTYCLHLQRWSLLLAICLLGIFFETSANFYQTTRHNIPEDGTFLVTAVRTSNLTMLYAGLWEMPLLAGLNFRDLLSYY
jgi:hypothetical protein